VPLWNRRFRREPQLAGDAHRAVRPETNLDSVLSIRQSRTLGQDHTVRWQGVIYRIERQQIQAAMRGARVQLERRLDGSTWMHWRKRVLALELCPAPSHRRVEPPVLQQRATAVRSAEEKARARQRLLDARRRWRETYNRLPHRPLWQAIRDSPSRAEGSCQGARGKGFKRHPLPLAHPHPGSKKRISLLCTEAELSTLP